MRISFMLWGLLFTTCIVFASTKSFGQKELDHTIRVNFKNISLREALEQLQTKHHLPLAYNSEADYLNAKVNYSGNKLAKEVLEEILQSNKLTYEIRHDYIRLVRAAAPTAVNTPNTITQQNREITGSVKDADGELLAGVSVSLKERPNVGTTTDINGRFILSVPPASTLVFQMVGYRTVEVPIGEQKVKSTHKKLIISRLQTTELYKRCTRFKCLGNIYSTIIQNLHQ